MANHIIGNPEIFAIELELERPNISPPVGKCRLWLQGHYLGDSGAEIYLDGVYRSLTGVLESNDSGDQIPDLPSSPKAFLEMIEGGTIENISRHFFLAVSGFDDFLKLFFRCADKVIVILCLHPSAEGLPEYTDYPAGVSLIEIPISIMRNTVEQFRTSIFAGQNRH